jgi:hypothetical protein
MKFTGNLQTMTTKRLLALLKSKRRCLDCLADWKECEHPSEEIIKEELDKREHVGP